jgi:hypothetical protein
MLHLSGLHLLLTYQCNLACDHCFVWGSPWQSGTMTLELARHILREGQDLGTVTSIAIEGGEPFLYYPVMLAAAREASAMGYKVSLVSNAYWATTVEDAVEWLRPLAGHVSSVSVSSDLYHWSEAQIRQAEVARQAAVEVGISTGVLRIAQPESLDAARAVGELPPGESGVMYRGRAVEKLVDRVTLQPWEQFTACPHENLASPGRVHVDAFGHLHVCQGISIGNLTERSLRQICEAYDPGAHPIVGPLLAGGPVELVQRYDLPHREAYADACHLCYEARLALRERFPVTLAPDQMYGVPS